MPNMDHPNIIINGSGNANNQGAMNGTHTQRTRKYGSTENVHKLNPVIEGLNVAASPTQSRKLSYQLPVVASPNTARKLSYQVPVRKLSHEYSVAPRRNSLHIEEYDPQKVARQQGIIYDDYRDKQSSE
ncbi:unnamed protein product [Meganyctiphanes norvegica]|uniref:Uncharacterized protein n=1 Tax=Meganyctiphanes norvegica TaxID=48144 RepID=A0AAV2PIW7_MEGNR